jgi:hypothetical protein
MSEPKNFASLTPSLLARKGAAKPAMRPQLQPMQQFHEATARQLDEDFSYNDFGDEIDAVEAPIREAEIVELKPAGMSGQLPEVVLQQQAIAAQVNRPRKSRRSALAQGRSAAFTLRLDAERHLKLRLACTLANCSAQQMVTEALDKMIAKLPEVTELAGHVARRN